MLSRTLNWAAGNDRARTAVEGLRPTRRVVERFVAGDDEDAAIRVAQDLAGAGVATTIDLLGEGGTTDADALRTRDAYLALLRRIADAGLSGSAEVSVKLSALGQGLDGRRGDDLAFEHAHAICSTATAVGSSVTLDMEGSPTVDSTLDIGDRLRQEFPLVANVLQANLRRTEGDLAHLIASARTRREPQPLRVRLVKGAYRESPADAFVRKHEVDEAYGQLVRTAIASPLRPLVATHDPAMIDLARTAAEQLGRESSSWELQLLHGVRSDLVHTLRDRVSVRVYVPYGPDWYPYFMRRLAERPANVAFFLRALARS